MITLDQFRSSAREERGLQIGDQIGALLPAASHLKAVVLFVDISGYTPLAERLFAQGTMGAEQLSNILDQVFSYCVGCVQEREGEVACFAGDALLAYWPVLEENNPEDALQLASACAKELQRFELTGEVGSSHILELHAGLAIGPIWVARIGGVDGRWQQLVAGDAVREACGAATSAGPGTTAYSPGVFAALDGTKAQTRDAGAEEAQTESSGLRPLQAPPMSSISQDGSLWLPQFRNICALSIQISGLNETAPDALDRCQALMTTLQIAVPNSPASDGALTMEDKGLVYRLCIGFPRDASSDDPIRAIRAALAIERGVKDLGFGFAAGLASGKGLCTILGGAERQHYVAVGRAKHVSARLMQHAGEGLLCADEVLKANRRQVDWMAERPMKFKGVADSLGVGRVRSIRPTNGTDKQLFGRHGEKRVIEKQVAAIEDGLGAIVLIAGEAGIGKSALVGHLSKYARSRGTVCLVGAAAPADFATSFYAWRRIFLKLLGLDSSNPRFANSAPSVLDSLAELDEPELAPLIGSVLPGLYPETDVTRGLSGRTRADATLDLLCEVIRKKLGDKFVLVLEDCHWMDSASWRLVDRVAATFPSAMLVLTSRPHFEVGELDTLRGRDCFTEISVAALDDAAIKKIALDLLPEVEEGSQFLELVVARSRGNPFFACEYSLYLKSKADNEGEAASIGPASIEDYGNPALLNVQGLIASRLDFLPTNVGMAVKLASVLGSEIDSEVFASAIAGKFPEIDLDEVLQSIDKHLIFYGISDQSSRYQFQHDTIRQVAYDQLTTAQKSVLHFEAATAIEEVRKANLEPHFSSLARHWQGAGNIPATVKYSDLAAMQALKSGAFVEADRHLQICLQYSEQQEQVPATTETLVRWHRALAEVSEGLGDTERRGFEARESLALSGRRRPTTRTHLMSQAATRAIGIYLRRSRALSDKGDLKSAELSLEISKSYRHSAACSWFANDTVGMTCDILGAVECAETNSTGAMLGSAYSELGAILAVVGFRRAGTRMMRRGLMAAARSGDVSEMARAQLLASLYAVGIGDWSNAQHYSALCQQHSIRMNDRVTWCNAQAIQFWLNFYQSRMEKAFELANGIFARAEEVGNHQHCAWGLRFLAICDLRGDRPTKAVSRLEQAFHLLGETAAVNERIPIAGSISLAYWRAGQRQQAAESLREGLALVRTIGRPTNHAMLEGYSAMAEVAMERWRAEPQSAERRASTADCLRILRRYRNVFPIGEPRYRLWLGHCRQIAGHDWLSKASIARAQYAADRLNMAWDTQQTIAMNKAERPTEEVHP